MAETAQAKDQSSSTGNMGRASRLVFVPQKERPYYKEIEVEFDWEKGLPTLANAKENAKHLQ